MAKFCIALCLSILEKLLIMLKSCSLDQNLLLIDQVQVILSSQTDKKETLKSCIQQFKLRPYLNHMPRTVPGCSWENRSHHFHPPDTFHKLKISTVTDNLQLLDTHTYMHSYVRICMYIHIIVCVCVCKVANQKRAAFKFATLCTEGLCCLHHTSFHLQSTCLSSC